MTLTYAAARTNKGLSQKRAAEKIGVSVATIQKWEHGKSYPSSKRIPIIELVYGVEFKVLIFLPYKHDKSVPVSE